MSCSSKSSSKRELSESEPTTSRIKEVEFLKEDKNAIVIRMREDDSILVEDQITHIDSIASFLQLAREEKGNVATVVLYVQSKTSHGLYSQVQLTLENEIKRFQEEMALEEFNKHYDDLKESQKRKINEVYHLRILERIH